MSLIKQILGSLVAATVVTIACQFLPVFSSLIGDYLPGVFLAVLIIPIIVWQRGRAKAKPNHLSKAELVQRQKECDAWHKENANALVCPSECYDARNIDRQLHIIDGFKNDGN